MGGSYQLPRAARLLALSCWLLAFPAGWRALEKGDLWKSVAENRGPRKQSVESYQLGAGRRAVHGL